MKGLKAYAAIGAALVTVSGGAYFAAAANAQAPTPQRASLAAQVASATPRAQSTNPHPTRLVGEVTAVGSTSITLSTKSGNVTANIGANTWIVIGENGTRTQGTISSIQTNKEAVVEGMTTADAATIDARVVAQGPKLDVWQNQKGNASNANGKAKAKMEAFAHGSLEGTVKAINGSTLTVTRNNGNDVEVEVSPDTVVLNNGFSTVGTIVVNAKVQVLGTKNRAVQTPTSSTAQSVMAWGIRVVNTDSELNVGVVQSVSGNSITVKTAKNATLTVNLSGTTGFRSLTFSATDKKATLSTAAQSSVIQGSRVIIESTSTTTANTRNADAVIVLPQKSANTTTK